MTTQEQRNRTASEAGYADGMAASLLQTKLHRISDGLSVASKADPTILYDTITRRPRIIIELDDGEMCGLIEWYTDGLCPVCFCEIPADDIICDGCYGQAQFARGA